VISEFTPPQFDYSLAEEEDRSSPESTGEALFDDPERSNIELFTGLSCGSKSQPMDYELAMLSSRSGKGSFIGTLGSLTTGEVHKQVKGLGSGQSAEFVQTVGLDCLGNNAGSLIAAAGTGMAFGVDTLYEMTKAIVSGSAGYQVRRHLLKSMTTFGATTGMKTLFGAQAASWVTGFLPGTIFGVATLGSVVTGGIAAAAAISVAVGFSFYQKKKDAAFENSLFEIIIEFEIFRRAYPGQLKEFQYTHAQLKLF